jgi:hypothetical protein
MLLFFSRLTGISPAQTGGENPGMNRFHILGSSQQGISVFCSIFAVYEKGLTMLLFFSLLTRISPAQTGGENPGINRFHILEACGSSEQKFRYVVFAEMSPSSGWRDSCQDSHFESAVGFGWQFLEGIAWLRRRWSLL